MDLHFGCGLVVYEGSVAKSEFEQLMGLFKSLNTDENDPNWKPHRSFFLSASAQVDFEFGENGKRLNIPGLDLLTDGKPNVRMSEHMPLVMGKIKDFRPKINELKVFKGKQELTNEAD